MSDTLALSEEHRIRQVREATVVQAALDQAFTRTINPADLDASFQTYLRAALAVLSVGRRSAAKTALSFYGDVKEAAELRRIIPDLDFPKLNVKAATTSLLVTGPVAVKKQLSTGRSLEAALAEARRQTMNYGKRATLNGGRETLIGLVRADTDAQGWARVSDGQPCAFCAMLVSRGPIYKRQTVDFKSHDGCGCGVRPFFRGESDGGWSPDARALRDLWDRVDPKDWRSAYQAAAEDPTTAVGAAFTTKVGARIAVDVTREAREFAEAQARAQIVVAPQEEAFLTAWREAVKDIPKDPDALRSLGVREKTREEMIAESSKTLGPIEKNIDLHQQSIDFLDDFSRRLQSHSAYYMDDKVPQEFRSTLRKLKISVQGGTRATVARVDKMRWELQAKKEGLEATRDLIKGGAQTGNLPRVDDIDPKTGEIRGDLNRHLDAILQAGKILDEEIERIADLRAAEAGLVRPDIAAAEARFHTARNAYWDARYDVREPVRQKYVERYGPDEGDWPLDARQDVERAVTFATYTDDNFRKLLRESERAEEVFRAAQRELAAYQASIGTYYREAVREVLAKVRPVGGRELKYKVQRNTPSDVLAAMRNAETVYPTDWLDRVANRFKDGSELGFADRGYNQGAGQKIVLSRSSSDMDMRKVAVHELGHTMEDVVPGLSRFEWAYLYRRATANQAGKKFLGRPEQIYHWIDSEFGWKDEFADHYTGKTYFHDKRGEPKTIYRQAAADAPAWEVFTTGAESLFEGSPYFDRKNGDFDYDFRRFMLGVISAL